MPNWCTTSYAVTGPSDQVAACRKVLTEVMNTEPCHPNGFGKGWLGDFVHAFGKNWKTVECRGQITHIDENAEDDVLRFDTMTAWAKMDCVEELILERWPDLDIYWLEEELGCEIFSTNDSSGVFFKETYLVDVFQEGMCYYNEHDALQAVSAIANQNITDWDEALEWTKKHNEEDTVIENEDYVYLHHAEIEP